jgi:hypothetical protein
VARSYCALRRRRRAAAAARFLDPTRGFPSAVAGSARGRCFQWSRHRGSAIGRFIQGASTRPLAFRSRFFGLEGIRAPSRLTKPHPDKRPHLPTEGSQEGGTRLSADADCDPKCNVMKSEHGLIMAQWRGLGNGFECVRRSRGGPWCAWHYSRQRVGAGLVAQARGWPLARHAHHC